MQRKRLTSVALAAVTVAAGAAVTGIALAGSVPMPAAAQSAPNSTTRTVTLVTGDLVSVSRDGRQVSAEPGSGRTGVTFTTTTVGGHVSVIPSDAGPLLAAGRLDARLFDVTGLLAAGYDRRDHLPLILVGGGRAAAAGVTGLATGKDLPAVNGTAVRQPRARAAESWRALTGGDTSTRALRSGMAKVWLDGLRHPTLDVSVPQVGAPAAWAAGYTGSGTTVAVLDTGIDGTHPDLAGKVVGRDNFTDGVEPDDDLSGHGTHVASTIAGTGAASGGRFTGVAPGANLLDGKVCTVGGCAESWIIAGMTWAAANQHAKVVNMSLGGPDDPEVVDPVEEAVQTLSEQYGTLFVVAAGNADGVTEGSISSPGTAPAALTVGAVDDNDALADFSRRGPGPHGALKPDIVAPGVNITAARGTSAAEVPGSAGDPYTSLSGTSMATPHVAGAAAILAQQHTGWSGQRLKPALMAAAKPNSAYRVSAQGAGRLDVARAVTQQVTSATGSVSFGRQQWPHTDDQLISREVSYHNDGAADVTLTLEMATVYPDGTPTPRGTFTVSPASVVVPAGGQATATVTVDTRVAGPDGYVGGWLTGRSSDLVIRTPVAVDKEVESYDVTLTHLDRFGATPAFFDTALAKRDDPPFTIGWVGPDPGNTVTLRVPAGHYTLMSAVYTGGAKPGSGNSETEESAALLAQPDLHVNQPLRISLDARQGLPISVTVPRSSATQVYAQIGAGTESPWGGASFTILGDSFANRYSARIGPDVHDDRFSSTVAGQWAQADPAGGTDNSPYFYALYFPVQGRMVHGYQRSVADRELAAVRADFAVAQPGAAGFKRVRTASKLTDAGNFGPYLRFSLPFTRTEYYNTDSGIGSAGDFEERLGEDTQSFVMDTIYTEYRAGRPYHETWNRGAFAPALPPKDFLWLGVTRAGDTMTIDVPRFNDGAGRAGDSSTTVRTTTLFRDGKKIADADGEIPVPPDESVYTLQMHTERGTPHVLSTKTDIAWTFRSGHVDADAPRTLPLWSFRFAPELDQLNTAPADRVCAVPFSVTPQQGAYPGELTTRRVDVSFDDGATWKPAPLRPGAALITHPKGSGFVSLRATAADTNANTVEQTIIHAYRYGEVR
jgi:subtilisin family serine protease